MNPSTPSPSPSALVTGATGFVGSHLVRALKDQGWKVHAIVRPESKRASLDSLLGPQNVHAYDGGTESVVNIVAASKPSMIFHAASLVLGQHTPEDASRLVASNIEFPTQLVQAMAVHGVKYLVNTGTFWQHYQEQTYNPVNLYAATKQAFADILNYYAEAGIIQYITLELFDTYGPQDSRPKLFNLLRQAATTGDELNMTSGEQFVDLTYISDVIDAYLQAAALLLSGQHASSGTYPVRTGERMRLRDAVELWLKITGRVVNIHWGARPHRKREVMMPWSGGGMLPGWQSKVSLAEGIRRMEEVPAAGMH